VPYEKRLYENLPTYAKYADEYGLLEILCDSGIQPLLEMMFRRLGGRAGFFDPDDPGSAEHLLFLAQFAGLAGTRKRWLGIGLNPDWPAAIQRDVIKRAPRYWKIVGTEPGIIEAISMWLRYDDPIKLYQPFGHTPDDTTRWADYYTPYGEYECRNFEDARILGIGEWSPGKPRWTRLITKNWEWDYTEPFGVELADITPRLVASTDAAMGPRNAWKFFYLNKNNWSQIFPNINELDIEMLPALTRPTNVGWLSYSNGWRVSSRITPQEKELIGETCYDLDGFGYCDNLPTQHESIAVNEVTCITCEEFTGNYFFCHQYTDWFTALTIEAQKRESCTHRTYIDVSPSVEHLAYVECSQPEIIRSLTSSVAGIDPDGASYMDALLPFGLTTIDVAPALPDTLPTAFLPSGLPLDGQLVMVEETTTTGFVNAPQSPTWKGLDPTPPPGVVSPYRRSITDGSGDLLTDGEGNYLTYSSQPASTIDADLISTSVAYTDVFYGAAFLATDISEITTVTITPVAPTSYVLTDRQGNRLTDGEGNYLTDSPPNTNILTDSRGNRLIDWQGNYLTHADYVKPIEVSYSATFSVTGAIGVDYASGFDSQYGYADVVLSEVVRSESEVEYFGGTRAFPLAPQEVSLDAIAPIDHYYKVACFDALLPYGEVFQVETSRLTHSSLRVGGIPFNDAVQVSQETVVIDDRTTDHYPDLLPPSFYYPPFTVTETTTTKNQYQEVNCDPGYESDIIVGYEAFEETPPPQELPRSRCIDLPDIETIRCDRIPDIGSLGVTYYDAFGWMGRAIETCTLENEDSNPSSVFRQLSPGTQEVVDIAKFIQQGIQPCGYDTPHDKAYGFGFPDLTTTVVTRSLTPAHYDVSDVATYWTTYDNMSPYWLSFGDIETVEQHSTSREELPEPGNNFYSPSMDQEVITTTTHLGGNRIVGGFIADYLSRFGESYPFDDSLLTLPSPPFTTYEPIYETVTWCNVPAPFSSFEITQWFERVTEVVRLTPTPQTLHPDLMKMQQAALWQLVLETNLGVLIAPPTTIYWTTVKSHTTALKERASGEDRSPYFDKNGGFTNLYLEFVFEPDVNWLMGGFTLNLDSIGFISDRFDSLLQISYKDVAGFRFLIPVENV